jgi:hypothetical protein
MAKNGDFIKHTLNFLPFYIGNKRFYTSFYFTPYIEWQKMGILLRILLIFCHSVFWHFFCHSSYFNTQSYIFFYIVNKISSYSKDMTKNTNWNTPNLRRFDLDNFGLSIDPSYTGKDPFGFKAGSHHTHTKIGMSNKKVRRLG